MSDANRIFPDSDIQRQTAVLRHRLGRPMNNNQEVGAETATVRKIFLHVIIPIVVLQILNSLDRVNVSFAALHMSADLGMNRAAYGLGVGLFFWGYLLFQYPSVWLLRRLGFRFWLGASVIAWGVISAAMAGVHSPAMYYLLRFLLGLAEAGFAPGVIVFIRTWLPANHRASAVALTMLPVPLSVIIGGPLAGLLMTHPGALGLSGWRWMFLAEAVPTMIAGLIALAWFRDTPLLGNWLGNAQKAWLRRRINQEDIAEADVHAAQHVSATHQWTRIALFSGVWFSMVSGAYSLIYWLPQVMKQASGFGDVGVGVLTALPWIGLGAGMVLNGRHSDRTNERFWHLIIPMLIATLGIMTSLLLHSGWGSLVALCAGATGLGAGQGAFWGPAASCMRRSHTNLGVVMINTAGNIGGAVSPILIGFVRDRTGSFQDPVLALTLLLAMGVVMLLPLSGLLRTNKCLVIKEA